MKTREDLDAIVSDVQHDRSRKVPRRERLGARAERSSVRQFVEAVLAFSVDPGPANLERYLAASRSLEESRSGQTPPPARPRTRGSRAVARRPQAAPRVNTAKGEA